MEPPFHVLLSHNSQDKPVVREIWKILRDRGLRPWLDEEELIPGRDWQEALEEIVRTVPAVAVFVGGDSIGPWENREVRACLMQFVDRHLPVIPVLLPGAAKKPSLPLFLQAFTWVDLRNGLDQRGVDRLVLGITGKKPDAPLPEKPSEASPRPVRGPAAVEKQRTAETLDVAYNGREDVAAARVATQASEQGRGAPAWAQAAEKAERTKKEWPRQWSPARVLLLVGGGFVIGLIARAVMPGAQHLGFILTTVLGIAGSLVGDSVGRLILKPKAGSMFHPAGCFLSIISSLLLLFLWHFIH